MHVTHLLVDSIENKVNQFPLIDIALFCQCLHGQDVKGCRGYPLGWDGLGGGAGRPTGGGGERMGPGGGGGHSVDHIFGSGIVGSGISINYGSSPNVGISGGDGFSGGVNGTFIIIYNIGGGNRFIGAATARSLSGAAVSEIVVATGSFSAVAAAGSAVVLSLSELVRVAVSALAPKPAKSSTSADTTQTGSSSSG
ncbi:PREDICTED: glycine-rich cell wall structural protein-like, partial [Rhagoletis zephyria]|uniref:glycine-rich cell wall structural protein-like n=1 Tax=Rhagoletis zephyria TaxID=28612 RepID=UPI000811887C